MKNIKNQTEDLINEMLQGYYYEHNQDISYDSKNKIIYQKSIASQDQVAIISGGGSGHEPAHFGYVGDGMLTAAVSGELFIPPTVDQIVAAIRLANKQMGTLLIIKNFKEDVDNFLQAKEIAQAEGHTLEHIIVDDDVSIEDNQSYDKRKRGVAGTIFVHKIVGQGAKAGFTLTELKALGETVIHSLHTLGVALTPATSPNQSTPSFTLADDEVYFGIGIHGEHGYRKEPFTSSERLAIELVNKLKSIYKWQPGETFAILVNGLGSTPLLEQYVFTNDIRRLMQLEELTITFVKVGSHLTSYDMKGISLSLLRIQDPNWIELLKANTTAPKW
ncbi:DhaKLM operon coactivator DhaQ [Paraliobacillus sediminis]|uniref:DhaKLM operon coactivator DhaQ n=1 Tax=Paraliobacillus sediminis TaxID=1885916 RepID=UPI000E3DA036|nr:DhaKLM operon coactivator DhaQ [Paraliobacillus sediminis]